MQYHLVTNHDTGMTFFRGLDGRDYTLEEFEALHRRAEAGDADASAELERNFASDDADPHATMQRIIDNCPDCQAARARGETPISFRSTKLRSDVVRGRRPRWRKLKRTVRR